MLKKDNAIHNIRHRHTEAGAQLLVPLISLKRNKNKNSVCIKQEYIALIE
jgi:hypothetical protein